MERSYRLSAILLFCSFHLLSAQQREEEGVLYFQPELVVKVSQESSWSRYGYQAFVAKKGESNAGLSLIFDKQENQDDEDAQ